MSTMLGAVARSLRDLGTPRVLAVLVLPMVGAILAWLLLAVFFWDAWTHAASGVLEQTAVARWLASHGMRWTLDAAAVLVVAALLLAAVMLTAIALTELVAMPVIVAVAATRYAVLEKRAGGTIAGTVTNASIGAAVFALLWIVTLPLWLTGVGAVLVPALNSAYLNQRLFRYDALAEHASRDEYAAIVRGNRGRLFGLGLLLAPLYYIPVVNLAAPVFTGLVFTHFCLAELAQLRATAYIRS